MNRKVRWWPDTLPQVAGVGGAGCLGFAAGLVFDADASVAVDVGAAMAVVGSLATVEGVVAFQAGAAGALEP